MLRHYWWFNGTNYLGGRTNSGTSTNVSFALNNVQLANEGVYSVVATNPGGTMFTQSATLTLLRLPVITGHPSDQTVPAGGSASFTVVADGSAPLSYQWRRDGTSLPFAPSAPRVDLSDVQLADAGGYSVVVSNSEGSVTSLVATLTVQAPPVLGLDLTNQTVLAGSNASLVLAASGSAPLSYQWWFNESNLLAQVTEPVLTFTNAQPSNEGTYRVIVSNPFGSATSAVATLTVLVPPVITQEPADQIVELNAPAVFTMGAGGSLPLAYQWQFGGTDLPGATTPVLTIDSARLEHAGLYRMIVSNTAGSVTSRVATLTVLLPPQPTIEEIRLDQIEPPVVTLRFEAEAHRTYSVLWRPDVDAGSWQVLTNLPSASADRPVEVQDALTGPSQRYYRLLTPAGPP
jgi:hypothetical protein